VVIDEGFPGEEGALGKISDPDLAKVVFDWKAWLHRHPEWAGLIKGPLLDAKILAWLVNPSEESYAQEWLEEKYGAQDLAALTFKMERQLRDSGLWSIYETLELPLISALFGMEHTGITLDRSCLESLERQWSGQMQASRQAFMAASGAPPDLNLNSPKQLAFLLFEKMKLPTFKKIKTGFSTDEEVLTKLAKIHPAVKHLLEHRELAKLRSTYIEGLLSAINAATGKIHATFHQEGTQTGRLSCSNPNLQNIPVRTDHGMALRRAFVPAGEGWEFLSLDYSQIDLRVFAHLSGDPELIRFFQEGRDIHQETAKALLAGQEGVAVTPDMRRHAKAVNFGILYGMGAWGLARELDIDPKKAEEFIDLYNIRFPGVQTWKDKVIEDARRDGYVKTLVGRVRFLEHINSSRRDLREFSERAAVNTPVQGTSSDIVKIAMIKLLAHLAGERLKTRMLLQVHDEILLEGPRGEMIFHAPKFCQILCQAVTLKVPLEVHAKMGPNWRDIVPL
ncbi:MAG: DNA polymerase, partial [Elusimicrobiota bacterium]